MAQPRTERKRLYTLPVHLARRQMTSHLSDDLMRKYGRRNIVVRKGDTVKVMRGDFAGTTGKVVGVDTRTRRIEVDGVTVEKADKTKVARQIDPSNLLVTKIDLHDRRRREKLGASEADVEPAATEERRRSRGPEERGAAEAPKPKRAKAAAAAAEPEPAEEEAVEEDETEEEEETKKPVRGARQTKAAPKDEEE